MTCPRASNREAGRLSYCFTKSLKRRPPLSQVLTQFQENRFESLLKPINGYMQYFCTAALDPGAKMFSILWNPITHTRTINGSFSRTSWYYYLHSELRHPHPVPVALPTRARARVLVLELVSAIVLFRFRRDTAICHSKTRPKGDGLGGAGERAFWRRLQLLVVTE